MPAASVQPNASATFVGYTNDASGTCLARFAITNQSNVAIRRAPKCLICSATSTGAWLPNSGVPLARGQVLEAGASEIITIKAPVVTTAWRASFYVSNEVGIRRLVNAASRLIRRPSWYVVITRQVDSGRIEPPHAADRSQSVSSFRPGSPGRLAPAADTAGSAATISLSRCSTGNENNVGTAHEISFQI